MQRSHKTPTYKKLAVECSLLIFGAIISTQSYAQFGGLVNQLKGQVADAVAPTKPASNEQPFSKEIQQYQDNSKKEDSVTKQKSKTPPPKSTTTLEIKGLKMLMPRLEAINQIQKTLRTPVPLGSVGAAKGCILINLNANYPELWEIGDQAIVCEENFELFGRLVPKLIAIFDDDKLAYVSYGELRGSSTQGKTPPLPDFYQALADKFNVQPTLNSERERTGAGDPRYNIQSSFLGPQGEEIEVVGRMETGAGGPAFSRMTLTFYEPDFEKRRGERIALLKASQEKAKKAAETKRKSDL